MQTVLADAGEPKLTSEEFPIDEERVPCKGATAKRKD